MIRENAAKYSVEKMCQLYGVSRSSYYDWVNAQMIQSERAKEDATILKKIETIYAANKKRYGSRAFIEHYAKYTFAAAKTE